MTKGQKIGIISAWSIIGATVLVHLLLLTDYISYLQGADSFNVVANIHIVKKFIVVMLCGPLVWLGFFIFSVVNILFYWLFVITIPTSHYIIGILIVTLLLGAYVFIRRPRYYTNKNLGNK